MISEFSVHPKPRNNNAKIFFTAGLFLSALAFFAYLTVPSYKGLIGVLAIALITAAILIYTKYVSVDYYYDITFDSNEAPIFVVRQVTGKRQSTLCRIDMADIVKITYETSEERRKKKKDINSKLYVYTPTLFPPDIYRILAKNRYDSFELIIEGTEELARLLTEYSDEARRLRALEEE